MDGLGWKPVDLVLGGMLTAGLAFGVYRFGNHSLNFHLLKTNDLSEKCSLSNNIEHGIAIATKNSELEIPVFSMVSPIQAFPLS